MPSAPSHGMARVTSADAPPTMIDNVPSAAPSTPPETGASTTASRPAERRPTSSASARTPSGELVEATTRTAGADSPARSPPSPSRTSATCGRSWTMLTTTPQRPASSAGVAAQRAPAATSSSAPARRRLCTHSSAPRSRAARSRCAAMGRPMAPSPISPTLSSVMRPPRRVHLSRGACHEGGPPGEKGRGARNRARDNGRGLSAGASTASTRPAGAAARPAGRPGPPGSRSPAGSPTGWP